MANENDLKFYRELLKEETFLRFQIAKDRQALEKKHRYGPFRVSDITARLPYMSEDDIRHHFWPHDPENPTLKEIFSEAKRLIELDGKREAIGKTIDALAEKLGRDARKDHNVVIEEWSPTYRYPRLLKERANLTAKMRAIERRDSAVSQKDRHDAYDAERQAIHRELETIGIELGKDATQVRLDILASQFGNRELGLPGITAVDATWYERDGDEDDQPHVDHNEMNAVGSGRARFQDLEETPTHKDGIALIYDYSYIREIGGWGCGYESSRYSKGFSDLLEKRAVELCERIKNRFPACKVRLAVTTNDFSGVLHLNRQIGKFLYVDAANAESVVSWLGHNPEAWISAEEYRREKETETSLYADSAASYDDLSRQMTDMPVKIAIQTAMETIFKRDGAEEDTRVEVRTTQSPDRSSHGIFIRDRHNAESLADSWERRDDIPALVPMTEAAAFQKELKEALREPSRELSYETRRR